jgi:hypothetical protein
VEGTGDASVRPRRIGTVGSWYTAAVAARRRRRFHQKLDPALRAAMTLFAFIIVPWRTSVAMEFSRHDTDSPVFNGVAARGVIEPGDTAKLQRYLAQLLRKRNTGIYFSSPGGDLAEGIKLGRLLQAERVKTIVDGYEMCASACALAFLGGVDRSGNRWMSSTTTSRLGFHAFRNGDGSTTANTDETQAIVAAMLKYGRDVHAPMEIFIRTFGTPASSIYWFSNAELLGLGIRVWDNDRKCFLPCK